MSSIPPATAVGSLSLRRALQCAAFEMRRSETVALGYFVYVALLACIQSVSVTHRVIAFLIPLLLTVAVRAETRFSQGWSRVVRDWAALGLILVAYWEVDWFAGRPRMLAYQNVWITWDRFVLDRLGLRVILEFFGSLLPSGLELVYLTLYLIPAVCVGLLYWRQRRSQIDCFLTTLFLGTFLAYAMLPLFSTLSPRVAFQNTDLPHYHSFWRAINVWVLERYDISTSVFPSGHVAVAFSSAFGVARALPDIPWARRTIFVLAALVLTATVYCRYHYAADGVASLGISIVGWRFSQVIERNV